MKNKNKPNYKPKINEGSCWVLSEKGIKDGMRGGGDKGKVLYYGFNKTNQNNMNTHIYILIKIDVQKYRNEYGMNKDQK